MSAVTTANETATWTIDPTHSSVEFAIKHMMITTVRGHFGQVEGSIAPSANGAGWTVEAKMEASSIDTRVEQRDAHLRSADFLDAETYPHLTFRGELVRQNFPEAGERFEVAGELTIRGVTRPAVLDATFEGSGQDPWGGERASFTASTRIDRRDFGLTWNQALEAGGVLVANEVQINLDVQLVKQA